MYAKVGVDVDGVLANYTKGYAKLAWEITKKLAPLAPSHWLDLGDLTEGDDRLVWETINRTFFWQNLESLPFTGSLPSLCVRHRVYFVTTRPENSARQIQEQTAAWLNNHGVLYPSVIIAPSNKKDILNALDLDYYIDDKPENLEGLKPTIRTYLPRRTYNGRGSSEEGVSKPYTYTEVIDFNDFVNVALL